MNYHKNKWFSKVGLSVLLMRIIEEAIKRGKNEATLFGQPHNWKSNEPM
ncbi:MAG: hypothetical protein ACFNP4_07475 [Capnocytophaga gingivalis]